PPARSAPAPTTIPSAPAAPVQYRDGTYQGTGNSRRGGVQLAVTIQDGRIADVQFTRVFTEYPVSVVSKLPAQSVSRQATQPDRVSGATFSTQAFNQALQQALAQAR